MSNVVCAWISDKMITLITVWMNSGANKCGLTSINSRKNSGNGSWYIIPCLKNGCSSSPTAAEKVSFIVFLLYSNNFLLYSLCLSRRLLLLLALQFKCELFIFWTRVWYFSCNSLKRGRLCCDSYKVNLCFWVLLWQYSGFLKYALNQKSQVQPL